jgi:hypothetical protein
VVEHGVRGVRRARSDVALAGRRDVSQRSGRRSALLRTPHLHLEREVDLDRVVEIRRTSAAAVKLRDAPRMLAPSLISVHG